MRFLRRTTLAGSDTRQGVSIATFPQNLHGRWARGLKETTTGRIISQSPRSMVSTSELFVSSAGEYHSSSELIWTDRFAYRLGRRNVVERRNVVYEYRP